MQARIDLLESVLRQHHEWHNDLGEIGMCKDENGEWIEIDMSAEYSDSSLCEATIKALG